MMDLLESATHVFSGVAFLTWLFLAFSIGWRETNDKCFPWWWMLVLFVLNILIIID